MALPSDQYFEQLVPILRCPLSGTSLSLVGPGELPKRLENTGDCTQNITGAFESQEAGVMYLIRGGIVDLTPENAIATNACEATAPNPTGESQELKNSVMHWYDSFGWQRNDQGILNDTALFSQNEATHHGVYETLSHCALIDRFQGGQFLLDAASGAIAHPEYLAYSYHHRFRVCVDFSEAALQEASSRVGDRGFCIRADICQLPFVDESFDGVVSGYTVQHVPEDQQSIAIAELYRVLRRGNHLCLMTGQNVGVMHRVLVLFVFLIARFFGLRAPRSSLHEKDDAAVAETPPCQLYCHYRGFGWWRRIAATLGALTEIHCLRLFSKSEFKRAIRSRRGVRLLRGFEMMFSQMLARASYFVVLDLLKRVDDS